MILAQFRFPPPLMQVTILTAVLLAPVGHADTVIRSIDVATPRSYGYTIGDPVRQQIRLEVDSRYTLDRAALPKRRRVNSWLWLEDVHVRENDASNATVYTLALTYQILASPERITRLSVPQQTLFLAAGEARVPVNVAAWGLTVAPLTEKPDPSALAFVEIQPSMAPPPLPLLFHSVILALCGLAFGCAILLLLYLHWRLPGIARSNGPFAHALREIEALETNLPDAARYDTALRCTHRAFNATAGSVVFADTLAAFFEAHPEFGVRSNPIAGFFDESGNWFFADALEPAPRDLKHLIQLCRSCRDIERGIL